MAARKPTKKAPVRTRSAPRHVMRIDSAAFNRVVQETVQQAVENHPALRPRIDGGGVSAQPMTGAITNSAPQPKVSPDSAVFGQIGLIAGRQAYTHELIAELETALKNLLLTAPTDTASLSNGQAAPMPATVLGNYLEDRAIEQGNINSRLRGMIDRIVF